MTDPMRKWFTILLALMILLVAIAITSVWQFNRLLSNASIKDLHFQIETLGLNGARFSRLSFTYVHKSHPLSVEFHNAQLNWEWESVTPHLNNVDIEKLIVKSSSAKITQESSQDKITSPELPNDWRVPNYFPKHVNIHHILWERICGDVICSISAQVDIGSPQREQLTVKGIFSPGVSIDSVHQTTLNIIYSVANKLPKLDANLSSDFAGKLRLSTYLYKTTGINWGGSISGVVKRLDENWLQELGIANRKSFQSFGTGGLNLNGKWNLSLTSLLQVPFKSEFDQYAKALNGELFLEANIDEGFQVPFVGSVNGKSSLQVEAAQGVIKSYSLLADINAESLHLPDPWNNRIPQIKKMHFNMVSNENKNISLSAISLKASLELEGEVSAKIDGNFVFDLFSKKVIANGLIVDAKAKEITLDNYEFKNIALSVGAVGYWQPESFAFNLIKPSSVSSDIKSKSFNAKSARVRTPSLTVSGKSVKGDLVLPDLVVEFDGRLSVDKLSHIQLKENSWAWQGKTTGNLKNLMVEGELNMGSSLNIKHRAVLNPSKVVAEWSLQDIYLIAANPFSEALKAWPSLLTLARGKITGHGNVEYNFQEKLLKKSESYLRLQDVAGIYDTATFEGLGAQLNINTSPKSLVVKSDHVQLNQINKGFVFGPIQAIVSYEAVWEKLLNGKLALSNLECQVAQGTISTPAQSFDLMRSTQHLLLNVNKINLTNLLQQYPTSELSGSGLISGSIPLEINKNGVRIEKGFIAAEVPGGKLKYTSAKAVQLAKSQPSMKLLTEALNDFQYSVLSSDVNFNESGKLMLSVRLEGKNPSFEKGRPIHFNINFEEDIPAMLASIQLSSKVNDVIKKRLQEYLQKRPHTGDISIKR